jgi:hypothetical protein
LPLCPEEFVGAVVVRDDEEPSAPYLTIELRGGCELRIGEWPQPRAE